MSRAKGDLVEMLRKAQDRIEIGAIYKHYKGDQYRVVDIVLSEANLEPMVVYVEEGGSLRWTRGLLDFTEILDLDGILVQRFIRVEGAPK